MPNYLVHVSLINGKKVQFEEEFDDLEDIATTLMDESEYEWYYYETSDYEGAFLRSQIVDFVAKKNDS